MTLDEYDGLVKLCVDALPITDDDYGTDRQVDAVNVLADTAKRLCSSEIWDAIEVYWHKATQAEASAYIAEYAARCVTDCPEFRKLGLPKVIPEWDNDAPSAQAPGAGPELRGLALVFQSAGPVRQAYDDGLTIEAWRKSERWPDGRYYLLLCRDEYERAELRAVLGMLIGFAEAEGVIPMAPKKHAKRLCRGIERHVQACRQQYDHALRELGALKTRLDLIDNLQRELRGLVENFDKLADDGSANYE